MSRVHRLADWPLDIQVIAKGVAFSGESRSSELCPACNGGRTREHTLSIWLDQPFIVAKCWRASCGYSARVPADPNTKVGVAAFKPRVCEHELTWLSSTAAEYLVSHYRLHIETLLHWSVRELADRKCAIYMPVYGSGAYLKARGAMVRYFGGDGPKAISYKATDLPWQAWYVHGDGQVVRGWVIVEDQLSAMRAWQLGYTAVALLGTHINEDKAAELRAHSPHWKLALDRDAFGKAVKYTRKWPWLQVVRLEADLKDCTDAEIMERLACE